jgi:HD-like signal output (HDOD) protein
MHREWDMYFVDCGEAALQLLATQPFDVIVSDMLMPRMNGAELLTRVMTLYPTTVRLILSGYADKDLILKCVGSTHQYLSKPCDAESLKATIQRASNLEDALQSDRLKKLVCQMSRLPSIPSLYLEVMEKASRPDILLEEVGAIIGRDLGMTAQVLKLSNSAFFGLRRQLASPDEAVAYLGLDTIKSLVLSIHAFSQFEGLDSGPLSLAALWRHSMRVAGLAKAISKLEGEDEKSAEETFAAGMLHDVGKLVLAVNVPNDYAEAFHQAQSGGVESHVAEQRVFGATHADVGGYLIGLWGLPVPVVEAVALHHIPSQAAEHVFSPLTCIHAANALEWEQCPSDVTVGRPQLDKDYLEGVGVLHRLPAWRQLLADPDI